MKPENEQFITARLAEIKLLTDAIAADEQAYHAKIEAVRLEFERRTAQTRTDLETAQSALLAGLKKNKADIFPGKTDKVTLSAGVVLHQIENKLRKARHITVQFLRAMGMCSGIKVEESVDWQTIDTWSADQLKRIGTERKPKESFSYELT